VVAAKNWGGEVSIAIKGGGPLQCSLIVLVNAEKMSVLKFADQLNEFGTTTLLSVFGEPLCHGRVRKIVARRETAANIASYSLEL